MAVRRGGVAAGILALSVCGLTSSAMAQSGDDGAVLQLPAIKVTAGKRPQALSEINGPISVRTEEDLKEARVTRVEDLDKVFPGLVIRTRGNRAYSNITLRGVTSPDFYNPAVQIYVDGVPQDAAYFTQELIGVERVELLRGPQGTLYGRNAHGGVINIITRKPGDQVEGSVGGTFANEERAAEGQLAVPLVPGRLFGDVSLRWTDELGDVEDIATGEDDLGQAVSRTGRVRLRYAPDESPLDVIVSAQHERLRSHEELYLREALLHDRQFDSATQGSEPLLDRKVDTLALSVDYDFGGATFNSVTSYQNRTMTRIISRNTPEDQDSFSQEVRLAASPLAGLEGVVGAYFQDTNFEREVPGFPGFFGASLNQVDNRSYALFGEATYALTDTLDVTAGLRWSLEEAEIDFARAAPGDFAFNAEDSFSDFSPKLAIGWQHMENGRFYALVSRGFKPGGFNHTVSSPDDQIPYESETSTNFEIGWRGSLFDDRLALGAAAYWISAEDKQIYVGPLGSQVLRNIGDSESRGVEADMQIRPIDGLTLGLAATVGRSEFKDAVDPQTGADYDGNRLPYAPDTMVNASARYVIPIAGLPGALSIRGAGRYVSRIYFDEANSLSQGGYVLYDASLDLDLDIGVSLSLFAENITDKVYRTSSFLFGPDDVRSTVGEGRIIGITGRVAF